MSYTNGLDNPELYFQCKAYAGTGSSNALTLDGDEDMQPDLVWIKNRSDSRKHNLYDSVRGATKRLVSDSNVAEDTAGNGLTAFGTDGFTTGSEQDTNHSGNNFVAWCWKESATAGFDIVSYTGNGTDGTDDTDISHNLSAVPKMIIVKNRDAADAWQIYHGANTSAPETDYMVLNTSAATADAADRWSDEAPTSSVFTLGDGAEVNTDTENYIAYCFAPKQGYSAMGSYTGNGNADGAFVYTGFRPAYVMIKDTSGDAEPWEVYDNKRLGYNESNSELYPSTTSAEGANTRILLFSNGFKANINSRGVNGSGNVYIYMAFAEAPFVNSNGVPCNAR